MRTEGRHTRWSAFTFQTQLLPLTVPVTVSVVERFDAVRAARHQAARDALLKAAQAMATCPGCGHDLTPQPPAQEYPATSTAPAPAGGVTRRRSEAEAAATARMQALVEALVGRRPLSQLAGLAETSVLRWARAEGHRLRSSRESAQLLSVGVQQTRAETAELFGSVRLGGQLHAYAGQLEGRRGAWTITELRILRPASARGRREHHRPQRSEPRTSAAVGPRSPGLHGADEQGASPTAVPVAGYWSPARCRTGAGRVAGR